MAGPAKKRANEPEPRPIIVKKIIQEAHAGHHGGAWKVAYADFVTAMMAFFLLMWLLGATTEKQRKGLADYFTPTLVQTKENSAGSTGLFGGDSMMGKENYPTTGGQGNLAITIPRDATGTRDMGGRDMRDRDRQRFEALKRAIMGKLDKTPEMQRLRQNIRFTETREGLRIDLIDEADFAMFDMGTANLLEPARKLIAQVGQMIADVPNEVIVRGHTDGLPYNRGGMNNWLLSSGRAEATRVELSRNGVAQRRFARIEGVADREPFNANPNDPRNRRMSVVLAWSTGAELQLRGVASRDADPAPAADPEVRARIAERDDPHRRMAEIARRADMGNTMLPNGAVVVNADSIVRRTGQTPPGKTDATAHH